MITASVVAVDAAVSFAGPPAELLPLDGRLPVSPQRPVCIPLRPAPPPLAALDGTTGVVLVLEGRLRVRRFGVLGLHRAGSPTP